MVVFGKQWFRRAGFWFLGIALVTPFLAGLVGHLAGDDVGAAVIFGIFMISFPALLIYGLTHVVVRYK